MEKTIYKKKGIAIALLAIFIVITIGLISLIVIKITFLSIDDDNKFYRRVEDKASKPQTTLTSSKSHLESKSETHLPLEPKVSEKTTSPPGDSITGKLFYRYTETTQMVGYVQCTDNRPALASRDHETNRPNNKVNEVHARRQGMIGGGADFTKERQPGVSGSAGQSGDIRPAQHSTYKGRSLSQQSQQGAKLKRCDIVSRRVCKQRVRDVPNVKQGKLSALQTVRSTRSNRNGTRPTLSEISITKTKVNHNSGSHRSRRSVINKSTITSNLEHLLTVVPLGVTCNAGDIMYYGSRQNIHVHVGVSGDPDKCRSVLSIHCE